MGTTLYMPCPVTHVEPYHPLPLLRTGYGTHLYLYLLVNEVEEIQNFLCYMFKDFIVLVSLLNLFLDDKICNMFL